MFVDPKSELNLLWCLQYIFNPIQGNWYNTYNIDITSPTPEDERDCCDKCVDCYENCVKKCAKIFLKIAKVFVLFFRCFIDPCQACVVGGLILSAHCLQVCVLDILTFMSNKAVKPFLHVMYESCIYPLCVCMRVTLDAINICLEPAWIIMYRMVTPIAKLESSMRLCDAKIGIDICERTGTRIRQHAGKEHCLHEQNPQVPR